jgi:hypothetical protein
MLEDAIREESTRADVAETGGWIVAGVLTDLEAAVLTTLVGEAGLAGTLELNGTLCNAANDAFAKEP